MLVHLVDGTGADVGEAYATVRAEVAAYGAGLAEKPEIIALNKCDALSAAEAEAGAKALAAAARRDAGEVHRISGATGEGVEALMRAALAHVRRHRGEGTGSAARAGGDAWP